MAGRFAKSVMSRFFPARRCKISPVGPGASPTAISGRRYSGFPHDTDPGCQKGKAWALYLSAARGIQLVNKSSSVTLYESFQKTRSKYFEMASDGSEIDCFSGHTKEIVRQLIVIAIEKSIRGNQFFWFDPKKILLQQEGCETIVLVPDEDPDKDSAVVPPTTSISQDIYTDKIVGPVAAVLYMLQVGDAKSGQPKKEAYKEVLDLLHMSQNSKKWWQSIDDIMSHPLFWTAEEKMIAIASAALRVSDGQSKIPHGLPPASVKKRIRLVDWTTFCTTFDNNNFYQKTYVANDFGDGQIKVVCSTKLPVDWTLYLVGGKAFDSTYRFGDRTSPVKMLTFVRNITQHFPDTNFDAFADNMNRANMKEAVLGLDREYSVCLSIFNALLSHPVICRHPKDFMNILAIPF